MKKFRKIFSLLFANLNGSDVNDPNYFEGYGQTTVGETEELIKALQAQEGVTDISKLVGGGALQPQSLETQLAMLTFQEQHLKFFKDIGISKAFSTLEEYSIQDAYGMEGGFVDQMENPEESDAEFQRKYAVMKYIRSLWKVSDVLNYTRQITSAEVKNKQAAMMRALRITEKTLFMGDVDVISSSFDGLKKTIESNGSSYHVVDLRGATITEQILKRAAEIISVNYGTPTHMYNSPAVQTSLDSLLYAGQRLNQELIASSGLVGLGHKVTEMRTSFGNFVFRPDIFLSPETEGVPTIKDVSNPGQFVEGATSEKAPATPTLATEAEASVSGSKWLTAEVVPPGNYKYRVAAINKYGMSAACAASSNVNVASAGAAKLTITSGAGTYAETGWVIYRETAVGSGVYRKIMTVKKTGSPQVVYDKNEYLAGYSQAFIVDNTTVGEDRTMALKQLAPIHSVEYAKIAPYRWGTVNFYVTPIFYAPLRMVMIKNIPVATTSTRNPLIDL